MSIILKRLIGAVAGLALALGMTAGMTSPAQAKSNVWDRVAKCESGGNWKINTGNGYYGGLQFSSSTWKGYGGGKYASKANKATKSEQIKIARKVLAKQGAGAWPTCGRKAGLTKSNGKAGSSGSSSAKHSKKASHKKKSHKKATHKKSHKKSHKKAHKKKIKVRSGDTLAKIAKRYHVKGGWKAVWKLNKSKLKNPNHLKVGQKLTVKK